jgi:hypothetical protein
MLGESRGGENRKDSKQKKTVPETAAHIELVSKFRKEEQQ